MISLDKTICGDFNRSAQLEWLETNGIGGFAMATVSGMNTRRYHGLLVAAVRPPIDRVVLLSKLEETLILDGVRYDLATNRYRPGITHPQGFERQKGFRLDPFPVFTFLAGVVTIEKSVLMIDNSNTTIVRYRFQNLSKDSPKQSAVFEVRPLVAFRDYHSLNGDIERRAPPVIETEPNQARIFFPGTSPSASFSTAPTLHLAHNAQETFVEANLYRQFEYGEEQARGFDYHEDLFNPCVFKFALDEFVIDGSEACCDLIASIERHDVQQVAVMEDRERARRREQLHLTTSSIPVLSTAASSQINYIEKLCVAANQFIVRRGAYKSVIAGYPWFTDWGRDTMIALPGLALAVRRFDLARNILLAYAEHLSQGMIPNRFPDKSETPDYNTVDATLWFIHAAGELWRQTTATTDGNGTDNNFVLGKLYPSLQEIIRWHERGTRYGIKLDADGLLRAGAPGLQLTWMDAKVGDDVVTPRTGKPVEIQALWYSALCTLAEMAGAVGDSSARQHYRELAATAERSFNRRFWNTKLNCLIDCLRDDDTVDDAVRPNQIFAVSLPHSMLDAERARAVVATVERELLTPYGLRTLSPTDSNYCGRYTGDGWTRDHAYHQGTVWPWLLGGFVTAYLKVHGRTPSSLQAAQGFLAGLREHFLSSASLNQISEIFDADSPHQPRGAPAQAWSVAELLRCELLLISEFGLRNADSSIADLGLRNAD